MKLQTISDFALDLAKELESKEIDNLEFKKNIENYANFLKQPLKLEMLLYIFLAFVFSFSINCNLCEGEF